MSCEDEKQEINPYGQVCWIEVPVTDPTRAGEFYTSVLEWDCQAPDTAMPSPVAGVQSVHMFTKGTLHGAFLLMDKGGQITNHDQGDKYRMPLLPTFCVRSIEETLTKAEKLGGKVHVPKTQIGGGMGFFSRFIDCEGNLVGIWALN